MNLYRKLFRCVSHDQLYVIMSRVGNSSELSLITKNFRKYMSCWKCYLHRYFIVVRELLWQLFSIHRTGNWLPLIKWPVTVFWGSRTDIALIPHPLTLMMVIGYSHDLSFVLFCFWPMIVLVIFHVTFTKIHYRTKYVWIKMFCHLSKNDNSLF